MISPDDLSVASKHLIYLIHFLLFLIQYNLCLSFSDFGLPYFLPIIFLVAFLRLQGKTSSYSSPVSWYCLLSWSVLKPLPWWSRSLKHLIMIMCLSWPTLFHSFYTIMMTLLAHERNRLHSCMQVEKYFFFPFTPLALRTKECYIVCLQQNGTHFFPSSQFSFFFLSLSAPALSPSPPPFQSSNDKRRKDREKKKEKDQPKGFCKTYFSSFLKAFQ